MIKSIDIPNNKIEYIEFGNGNVPFIIIPGLGARSVLQFEDAIINQYSSMINDYHIYLIDRPLIINNNATIESIADDYYNALIKLKIKDPIIFGNSMGGMIGLSIALKYNNYVNKLILSSSCSRVDDYSKNIFNKWKSLSKGDLYEFNKQMAEDIYSKETIDKYNDALINPYMDLTNNELEKFQNQCIALLSFDVFSKLNNINTDLYFIGSKIDNVFKCERYIELKPFTKEFYIYDNYSHMVCDEANDYISNILKMIR